MVLKITMGISAIILSVSVNKLFHLKQIPVIEVLCRNRFLRYSINIKKNPKGKYRRDREPGGCGCYWTTDSDDYSDNDEDYGDEGRVYRIMCREGIIEE
jgi:hypothetical protein